MSNKKVLVTGATGSIGFHTAKAVLERGHTVAGLDNINDYYDVSLKYGRLAECGVAREGIVDDKKIQSAQGPEYFFQKSDITDLPILETLFVQERFDYVIYLVVHPGVRYSLKSPHAYIQSNMVGFINILECCRHHQIKHLVYASSSSTYGMNAQISFSEGDQVDHPVSLYATTKKSNELMAHAYSHLYKLPTTGLRFFTVYGSWGRPDMAPMLFANAIFKDDAIKAFNGGDMQRDFIYVDDIVEGVVRTAENIPTEEEKRTYYRLLNIGNSKPIQLMDFIWAMEKKAKLDMYPMQAWDVKVTYTDSSALKRKTNHEPMTTIRDGVQYFVTW